MSETAERIDKLDKIWTVQRVLAWTQQRFGERGIPSPRLDAELLLSHSLGRPRVALYTSYDQPLGPEELAGFRQIIRRRLDGEPVAYLIGQKDFWSLTLKVSQAVLIPRPETETLVEVALALLPAASGASPALEDIADLPTAEPAAGDPVESAAAEVAGQGSYRPGGEELTVHYDSPEPDPESEAADQAAPPAATAPIRFKRGATLRPAQQGPSRAGPLVADIGTGSGAVALALQKERRSARIFAVDCSPAALEVAADNAKKHDLPVTFLLGDLLEPLSAPVAEHGPFDLIVSNPPYIPAAEIAGLQAEVRSEPLLALDGGPDGLAVIRRLLRDAPRYLASGGALAMEVGAGQADAVAGLMRDAGFAEIAVEDDLARIPRVVSGRWPGR